MTEVIFSFDTEDYTNPGSDDAILRLAEVLRDEGIRASFNMVAALAEALVARGRQDIIDALAFHEINYHTYRHSWHPVPAEYSDVPDWDGPYHRLVAEEAPGIELVKRIFGRERLYAAIPPGNCVTAQALHAYRALGLPLCVSGFPLRETGGRSIFYCGGIYVENNAFWDSLLLQEGLEGVLNRIEQWRGWDRLVICMHPNIIFYPVFWDKLNLEGRNQVEWGQWRLAEPRSPAVIEQFFADFRAAVRLLKRDRQFHFSTFQQVVESWPARPDITWEALRGLLDAASRRFTFASAGGSSYSPAEMLAASLHFLSGEPGQYGLKPLIGPTSEPAGVSETCQIRAADLQQAARSLAGMDTVPSQIQVGSHRIGPRDFLEAARYALSGAQQIELHPGPQMPDLSDYDHLGDARLDGTWLYAPDFKDEWVSRRLQWQAWTIHA